MSVRALQWVIAQRIASRALTGALMALATRADKGGKVVAAQATIAADMGVSERQLRHHLSALEALGVIHRDHRNKGNRGRTTDLITLSMNCTFDLSKADIAAAGYNAGKGRFSSGSQTTSLPEVSQPLALPGGNFRANREYISKGSAKPNRGMSFQGVSAGQSRVRNGEAAPPVEGAPPTSKLAPHGKAKPQPLLGSHYATHRALLDRVTRGTVH